MKKISVLLFPVILALSASAQKVVVVHPAPRLIYTYQPYYFRPYYGFGFNYGWYNRPLYYHQTKLDKQIQGIEDDYGDRISSVRADDGLTGHERREKIRALKHERTDAVDDAKKNYYKRFEN